MKIEQENELRLWGKPATLIFSSYTYEFIGIKNLKEIRFMARSMSVGFLNMIKSQAVMLTSVS